MRRYGLEARFFAPQKELLAIEGEKFHHIVKVCRHDIGDRFEILVQDQAFCVELTEITHKQAQLKILSQRKLPKILSPQVHLALSCPRFSVVEYVIEKAVEMGVSELHLFHSQHSFIRSSDNISSNKYKRWEKIVKKASEQTGRGSLFKIHPLVSHNEVLERYRQACAVGFCASLCSKRSLKSILVQTPLTHQQPVWLFIGPEGGFSTQDFDLMQDSVTCFSLGGQVLRVETACLVGLSLLKYELGHWSIKHQD